MALVTASALPSTVMPSESTVGGFASVITTARPAWPLIAPLATLILPPCLTQVTEFRSRPDRSLPSTLTSVLPPVLTCAPPAAVAEAGPLLLSEQPTSTAAAAASPTTPTTTRFIALSLRRTSPRWRPSWAQSRSGASLPIPNFVGPRRYGSSPMRSFTVDERRARLARRHFLAESAGSIDGVAADLVGLHATDPATPYLSLWARLPGFAVADLDAELYGRRMLVKHLAMRRTLWTVRAVDLPLIQSGASDRVADNERRRLVADAQKAGITDDGAAWLDTACAAVLRHLAEHGAASAKELRAALPELAGRYDYAPGKSWGGETPLAPRVLTVLSVRGDIVRGPNDGAWTISRPRWTSMGAWLPSAVEAADPEVARAELVRRWLRTF